MLFNAYGNGFTAKAGRQTFRRNTPVNIDGAKTVFGSANRFYYGYATTNDQNSG